jgi:hypothetical protein
MLVLRASEKYKGGLKDGQKTGIEYSLTTEKSDLGGTKHVFRTFKLTSNGVELIDSVTYTRLNKSIKNLFNI